MSSTSRTAMHGEPARRLAVVVLVVTALVVAAGLPWLVPVVPRMLAGSSPGAPTTVPSLSVVPEPEPFVPRARPQSVVGERLPAAGVPRQLVVDRLGVRSEVVPISGATGVLVPPADATVLGWWQEGAVPGAARGSAVLTGHTVHTGGGAFDRLRTLRVGDRVRVQTSRGAIGYAVARVRVWSTAELARRSRRVFGLQGAGRLVLVTCSDWNGAGYDTNTVVEALPVALPTHARTGRLAR